MATVNPYLNFSGNCEEAFNFYKSVFGGELSMIMRFKDMPAEYSMAGSEGEKIAHVSLVLAQGTTLMGSDRPATMGPTTNGNNFHVSITAASEEEATKLFKKLSADGQVTMPLGKTFWGAYFGMFSDKFGVQWMVSYDYSH